MDLGRLFRLTDEARRLRTEAVVEAVRRAVEEEAPDESYRESVTSRVVSPTEGEVKLGEPGVFREGDQPTRDMRDSILKSPKAKVSKETGARYMSIPMKGGFRTASTQGQPWYRKSTTGVNGIGKARLKFRDILIASRGEG